MAKSSIFGTSSMPVVEVSAMKTMTLNPNTRGSQSNFYRIIHHTRAVIPCPSQSKVLSSQPCRVHAAIARVTATAGTAASLCIVSQLD